MNLSVLSDKPSDLGSCSLPETFCLWAGEAHDLACHIIKHLRLQIRGGNWASRRMLIEPPPLALTVTQAQFMRSRFPTTELGDAVNVRLADRPGIALPISRQPRI